MDKNFYFLSSNVYTLPSDGFTLSEKTGVMSDTPCFVTASVWFLVPIAVWLVLPICADTEERRILFLHTQANKHITSGLNTNIWLICQLFLSLAMWKFTQHSEDRQLQFGIWSLISVLEIASWIAVWVVHNFPLAVIFLLLGESLAVGFCVWAFRITAYAGVPAVIFTLLYSAQLATVWFFQKANKQAVIPNREINRFEMPSARPNANAWFITQDPTDHVLVSV